MFLPDGALPVNSRAMSSTARATVHLLPSHAKRLRQGHPWVYSNELRIDAQAKALPAGDIVRIVDAGGAPLGCATFNAHSLIAGRLLSRDVDAAIDAGFIGARIEAALALRERLFDTPFYRLVHAEADGLPGLIVDRYDDVFVCQPNTAGMTRLFADLLAALEARFSPRAVVLRGDSPARTREGAGAREPRRRRRARRPDRAGRGRRALSRRPRRGPEVGAGTSTSATAAPSSRGWRPVDVCSTSTAIRGGFALAAAARGAARVTAVDRSQAALDLGARSAELNGLATRCGFVCAEAFGEMERLGDAGERFDLVVVDPPSFVKSRKDIKPGLRAIARWPAWRRGW